MASILKSKLINYRLLVIVYLLLPQNAKTQIKIKSAVEFIIKKIFFNTVEI
jgi:hypothetical protein